MRLMPSNALGQQPGGLSFFALLTAVCFNMFLTASYFGLTAMYLNSCMSFCFWTVLLSLFGLGGTAHHLLQEHEGQRQL